MNAKPSWFQKHPLLGYFIFAYAISWAIGIPLALIARGKINWHLPFYLQYLYSFGPMLAALIMTGFTKGKSGIKDIFKRLTDWHIRPIWWIVAFSPVVGYLIIVTIQRLIQGTWVDFSLLGDVSYLPNLGIGALFLWILTSGVGEETGWRGYALPRLQQKMNALSATVVLGLLWALWHLPLFFYSFDPSIAVGWFFSLICAAIVFTWLFNSTKGSLLAVVLWHATFNYITSSKAGAGLGAVILSILVMVWAVALIFIYKPANLSLQEKQTIA